MGANNPAAKTDRYSVFV